MSDTHDTIDGLLAEFRGYSAGMPASYHVTMSWADFRKMLDRFDAAHKREVDALNEQIADLRQQRDLWSKRAAELVEKCNEQYAKLKQVGNAAKLREALTKVSEWMAHRIATGGFEFSATFPTMLEDVVLPALAAPPRNCDKYATADEAHKRERGNCAKLRDALVQVQKKINYLIGNLTVPNSLVANRMEINGIINAALAAPPRNCDVGSAEEQAKEFIKQRGAEVAVSKTETTTPVAVAENATTTQAHLKPLNMAECRSALEAIADIARTGSISTLPSAKLILRTCEKALAAPPRNCDVGVPEERIQRWSKFCKARSKKLPPIHGFEWEDYPYKEGDAK